MSDSQRQRWSGWKRRAGSSGPWEEVGGFLGTLAEAQGELMRRTELAIGQEGEWEYRLTPAGQRPAAGGQTYRHRMMGPRRI